MRNKVLYIWLFCSFYVSAFSQISEYSRPVPMSKPSNADAEYFSRVMGQVGQKMESNYGYISPIINDFIAEYKYKLNEEGCSTKELNLYMNQAIKIEEGLNFNNSSLVRRDMGRLNELTKEMRRHRCKESTSVNPQPSSVYQQSNSNIYKKSYTDVSTNNNSSRSVNIENAPVYADCSMTKIIDRLPKGTFVIQTEKCEKELLWKVFYSGKTGYMNYILSN